MKKFNQSISMMLLALSFTMIACSSSKDNPDYPTPIPIDSGESGKLSAQLSAQLYTDKATYKPGETVTFTVSNVPSGSTLVRYRQLDQVIKEEALSGDTWTWTPPTTDYTGYMVDLYQKDGEKEKIVGTIAVDVSSDWKVYPRYGFVATFDQSKSEAVTKAEMKKLARYHINGVQFQDWHWKHHWPLGGTRDKLLDTYTDIANRTIYTSSVKNYIAQQHAFGMKSIFYNLCFGALDEDGAAEDGVKAGWYLFTDTKHTNKDSHNLLSNGWKSNIYLVNPDNAEWQAYLAQRNDDVYANLDFDGYQIDQLGDRGTLYDYNGKKVDLPTGYASFINAMKAKNSDKSLIMNAVSGYGQEEILKTGKLDFAYNEVWGDQDQYADLLSILNTNKGYDSKIKTVFAAYMNYNKGSGLFNIPGVLLADAVMFSLGGTHLELGGDHMLTTEYFPNDAVRMNTTLQNALMHYYDFQTAYETLLMGESYEINPEITGSRKIVSWTSTSAPQTGAISAYSKQVGDYQITHLINFVNANSMSWRDVNGDMPSPTTLTKLTVTVACSKAPTKVWMASPDQYGGVIQSLDFTYQDGKVTVVLPKLQYWDMLVIK